MIILASTLAALNPVVVGAYFNFEVMPTVFLLVFDSVVAAIGVLCFLHFRTRRRLYLAASLIGVLCLPIVMGLVELTLTYIRLMYGEKWNGIQLLNVHRSDSVLGWLPVPNAKGRHLKPGSFDVIYEIDEKGRKAIPQNEGITRTLHFFGDSFTFGLGVNNEDTALNILAARRRDQFNVLNYGVSGYGLEQMVVRLRASLDEVKPDDAVIFSPLTTDFHRNLINNGFFCAIMLTYNIESVPVFRDGDWHTTDLREECDVLQTLLRNSKWMPLGEIYNWYNRDKYKKVSLDHAAEVLAQAAHLVQQRNAYFLLVILLTPDECERGALDSDLHRLNMPFESLMSFCPEDPKSIKSLRFPNDGHWSLDGNQWAARALEEVLKARLP